MHKVGYSVYALALFLYCLFVYAMPHRGLMYDIECWINWAQYMHQYGLGRIYESDCNYLPAHLFELKVYTLLFPDKNLIIQNIYYLKYFTFFFDVAGALLISSLLKDESKQKMVLMIMLLNPAYIHNTVAWGQFDSVFTFFIFASFVSLFNKRYMLSTLLFVISLNFKFQAIMFFPALLLMAVYLSEFKIEWKKFLIGIVAVIVVQTLMIMPFILQSTVPLLLKTIKSLAGEYNYISVNAANIWRFLQPGDLRWTGDWNKYLSITFKTWGLIMLAVAIFITTFPLMKGIYLKFRKKSVDIPFTKFLLIFGLIPLCFFYFNTQMHERYSYPAFIFIAAFAVMSESWWLYILFSAAYFLNNEGCLQSLSIFNYHSTAFDFRFISCLFLATIISAMILLYLRGNKNKTNISNYE